MYTAREGNMNVVEFTLYITTYRMAFAPTDPQGHASIASFDLPLTAIDSVLRLESVVTLACKDTRVIHFDLRDALLPAGVRSRVYHLLMKRMSPPRKISSLFAFDYAAQLLDDKSPSSSTGTNGWLVYSPAAEYERLGFVGPNAVDSSRFQLLENSNFRLVPSYPQFIVVPAQASRTQLSEVVTLRVNARIPVAVWRHPVKRSTLARSSNPKFRFFKKRCAADELLLRHHSGATHATEYLLHPSGPWHGFPRH